MELSLDLGTGMLAKTIQRKDMMVEVETQVKQLKLLQPTDKDDEDVLAQ